MRNNKKSWLSLSVLLCISISLAAGCKADADDFHRDPTPVFAPTPADQKVSEGVAAIKPIAEATKSTTGSENESAIYVGDVPSGEKLFADNGCSACHNTSDETLVGPGLSGIFDRAENRVSGMSASAYLEQSIRDPGAFLVDGFTNLMPSTFGELSDKDMQDLIAFISSLH